MKIKNKILPILIIILFLLITVQSVIASDIELIAKIAPKNDGFRGMVDADQIIDQNTTEGFLLISDGEYFDGVTMSGDGTIDRYGVLSVTDGTSLWNDNGTALHTATSGRDIRVNGSINATGNISLIGDRSVNATGTLTLGRPGDIILGDDSLRVMRPQTNASIDLGTSDYKFNDLWVMKIYCSGVVDPPTVLYDLVTHEFILDLLDRQIPKGNPSQYNGMAVYFDGNGMFAVQPSTGYREEFVWKSDYDLLEQRVKNLEKIIEELIQ